MDDQALALRGLSRSPTDRNSGHVLSPGMSTLHQGMHYFWVFLVWMVYSILGIGVLEAYSERDARLVRGAGVAMVVGGILAVALSVVILWFGPVGPW